MIKFLKIFIGFLSFLFLVFLISLTFFSGDNKIKKTNDIFLGAYSNSGTNVHVINDLDFIYSKNKDFKINNNKKYIDIKLNSGEYILSLNDFTKKYNIYGSGFSLDLKTPGDIYINTKSKNILIFSLNSSFYLNFLGKDGKIINKLFIYPHEIYKFNYKFNDLVFKKADIYRIRILNKSPLSYISKKLENLDYLDVKSIFDKDSFDFLKSFVLLEKRLLTKYQKIYSSLKNLRYIDFPLKDFVEKNLSFLLNKEKKSYYYQIKIYNSLIKLFNSEKFNSSDINNIKNDLLVLKSLDKQKYDNLNKFITNLYKIILFNNSIDNYSKLKNFLYLKENYNSKLIDLNHLRLKKLYFNYDYSGFNKFDLYFEDFLDEYFVNLGIIKKQDKYFLKKSSDAKRESFLFYLRNIIDTKFFNLDNKDLSKQVNILQKYILLDKLIYFQNSLDEIKIKTSLIENRKILEKIKNYLRKTYFLESRDKNNLLLLNRKKEIDYNSILKLEKEVKNFLRLFYENKNILENEEIDSYIILDNKFKEYFLALKDYSSYIKQYNKKLKEIYEINGLGKKKQKQYFINDIYNYLKKFNDLSFSKDDIIKNKDYFEIKNVSIFDKKYNFRLYPYLRNKLDVYDTNGKYLFSYILDDKEKEYKEKIKGVKQEEKYKYDFKNFFSIKFSNQINSKKNNLKELCRLKNKIYDSKTQKCIDKIQDSQVIALFKQNKLLKEEFNILRDFFYVKYNNIYVTQKGDNYEIKLKDVLTNIDIKDKKYKLYFSSDYDFKNHKFFNIKIKVSSQNTDLLDGNYINFKYKKVYIKDLKKFLQDFMKNNFQNLLNLYGELRSNIYFEKLSIDYMFNKYYLTFSNNNKQIKIKFDKNKIFSIIVNNSNILDKQINVGELKNYISKFK